MALANFVFRLSPDDRQLLQSTVENAGVSKAAVIRQALRIALQAKCSRRLNELVEIQVRDVTIRPFTCPGAYSGLTRSPVSVRPDRSFRSDPITRFGGPDR